MPEEIAFARRRPARRYHLPRVDGAFAAALLISFLLVVPPVLLGWSLARGDDYIGIVLAVLAGGVASMIVTFLAARAWLRFSPSDRLFADATITGWLRTYRAERQVARAREIFDDPNIAPIELHVDRLVTIAHSLEARDARTHRHSIRVAMRAAATAKELGLDADEIARVRAAAKLHDIGALNVPNWVGATNQERAEVARAGASLLGFTGDRELVSAIRHQHELYDGTGTPDGLKGAAIPLTARIIAVADAYDLAAAERGQRSALAELREGAGSRFDPDVVDALAADAMSNPTAALRGAVSGAFPRAAQGAADLVRGTASVAAAASIATTAVVAGGAGVQPAKHDGRADVQAATVASAAPVALRSGAGGSSGSGGSRKHDTSKAKSDAPGADRQEPGSNPAAGDAPGSGHLGGSGGDDGSGGGSTHADKPAADPVKDLTDNVSDTVDSTTQTVDDTVQGVVDTVDDTVKNTTDTVNGVVGGLTGNK